MAAKHPLIVALEPLAEVLGADLVSLSKLHEGDIPLHWEGELVGALRLPGLAVALDRLIRQVEAELGGTLSKLSREDKQSAVKILEERGAFTLRKSIEDVADAMGVSRITIYNYLNAIRTQ